MSEILSAFLPCTVQKCLRIQIICMNVCPCSSKTNSFDLKFIEASGNYNATLDVEKAECSIYSFITGTLNLTQFHDGLCGSRRCTFENILIIMHDAPLSKVNTYTKIRIFLFIYCEIDILKNF